MNLNRLLCFAFAVSVISSPAYAGCEKWKSEIASLVGAAAKYYDAYTDYGSGSLDLGSFQSKASKAVASIDEVSKRLESIESCPGFEGRANKVTSAIALIRPAMVGLQVIEPIRKAAFSE